MHRDESPARVLVVESLWNGDSATAAETVRVELRRRGRGLDIRVDAPFHGDPAPPASPGPTDRLWEFEVVELFIAQAAGGGAVRYTEIELSPFGHHLVIRFAGVRNALDRGLQIAYRAGRSDGRWTGRATLPARYLPPEPWRANAYALHGRGASRRYLAAFPLPGRTPDFHQPERFPALEL